MLKKTIQVLLALVIIFFLGGILVAVGGVVSIFNPMEPALEKSSILALDLDGIIFDGAEFIETLAKYRTKSEIKGVLITLNSPGGIVGPSQEIYREIQRTSKEFNKPVYVYCRSLAASGAYYAAVGADRIFTTPGCFMGSIGVIMEFINLEKLYDWAKVQRYALTTGEFKDTGADYRPMRPAEKEYLQSHLTEVLGQFKKAVAEGRKDLKPGVLDENADGRVFSGQKAVDLGFADEVGTWEDAKRALGEKLGIGPNPKIFKPKKALSLREMLEGSAESKSGIESAVKHVLQTELKGQPLFIFPGALGL